jgi:hypothetical protein
MVRVGCHEVRTDANSPVLEGKTPVDEDIGDIILDMPSTETERYTFGRREPWTPRHFSSLLLLFSSLVGAAGSSGGAGFRRVAVLTLTF